MRHPRRTSLRSGSLDALGLARILLGSLLAAILGVGLFHARAFAYGTPDFPCPPSLEPRVGFWIQIFSHYSGEERVIHDSRYPWIIYEVWDAAGLDQKEIQSHIDRRKKYYGEVLENLAVKDPALYTLEEKRVSDLFSDVAETAKFTRARDRVRSQPGVREQMLAGMIRSGRYVNHIQAVLDSLGVPPEVAFLPHVESSFNPAARSKVGAVGLWQFTHDTGRRFLRIENDFDERLDPFLASEAAASYLKRSYEYLGSWPLAIMSYNHGPNGIARAVETLGTTDVGRILGEYDGPSFGFASRNFYCEFLAALEIGKAPDHYFGPVAIEPPLLYDEYALPQYVKLESLCDAFGCTRSELEELNPAFGASNLQGSRPLPKGYRLRLPEGRCLEPAVAFSNIDPSLRFDALPSTIGYRVRSGDTLAMIAKRHRVSVASIRKMNHLGTGNHIKVGQVLVLPDAAFPAR